MAFFDPLAERFSLLTPSQKIGSAAALVLILALLLTVGWIKPRWDERTVLQEDIERAQLRLAQINKTLSQIKQFQQELADIDIRLKQVAAILPESREIPELLKGISNLGQENGLEFLLFKPEKENPREFVSEIPVTVNLKGNYHQIAIFFDQVRRSSRLVNVRQLEMGPYDEKTGQINTRFQLVTYTALSEAPPGTPPATPGTPTGSARPGIPDQKKTTP